MVLLLINGIVVMNICRIVRRDVFKYSVLAFAWKDEINHKSSSATQQPVRDWNRITLEFKTGGARGSVVVKALCYKPEGRGFDSR
jgi:hypothetical protein